MNYMKKIPSKYIHMVFLGTFMTGVIAYSEISAVSSSTLFDKLTMTPLIALGGGLISAVIALIIWAVTYLRDSPSSRGRTPKPEK